jgi:hypothetical protein
MVLWTCRNHIVDAVDLVSSLLSKHLRFSICDAGSAHQQHLVHSAVLCLHCLHHSQLIQVWGSHVIANWDASRCSLDALTGIKFAPASYWSLDAITLALVPLRKPVQAIMQPAVLRYPCKRPSMKARGARKAKTAKTGASAHNACQPWQLWDCMLAHQMHALLATGFTHRGSGGASYIAVRAGPRATKSTLQPESEDAIPVETRFFDRSASCTGATCAHACACASSDHTRAEILS